MPTGQGMPDKSGFFGKIRAFITERDRSMRIEAYAVMQQGGALEPFAYDAGELRADDVNVEVESCGVCHSDLSMIDNEWGFSSYPLVPGHEVVGTVTDVGPAVVKLKVGDRVGIGWLADSCGQCRSCLSGHHNLCPKGEQLIVGRHGGFANSVRASELWCIKLPPNIDPTAAGPLFCGGATVFNPLVQYNVSPMDKVGVIGLGGLGHLALQFTRAWGCEVTAFTTSESKTEEAKALGAHHVVATRDKAALKKLRGQFDVIINTVAADLPWDSYVAALCAKGRLINVGAFSEGKVNVSAMGMLGGEKRIGGSAIAPPVIMQRMLEFCGRHGISPKIETFAMADCNDGIEHLRQGKARYRVVLTR